MKNSVKHANYLALVFHFLISGPLSSQHIDNEEGWVGRRFNEQDSPP